MVLSHPYSTKTVVETFGGESEEKLKDSKSWPVTARRTCDFYAIKLS